MTLENYEIQEIMHTIAETEAKVAEERENLFACITGEYEIMKIIKTAIRKTIKEKLDIELDIQNMSTKEFNKINNFIDENQESYIKQVLTNALKDPKALAEAENREKEEEEKPVDLLAKALAEMGYIQ